MKINDLTPASRAVQLAFKVLEMQPVREVTTKDGSPHSVTGFLVADETGCVQLSAWDEQIKQIEVGKTYELKNGYCSMFQNKLQLNIGRYGSTSQSEQEIANVDRENNLSERLSARSNAAGSAV